MVTVRVEHGDVLDRKTDVLVLPYPQGLQGVSRTAVSRVGCIRYCGFPEVGHSTTLRSVGGVGARDLVLLGVEPIGRFGYSGIRNFGRRCVVETRDLGARELCLTLHGARGGLDEGEAFRAEVAGLLNALDDGRYDPGLEYVTVVERDRARANRLVAILEASRDLRHRVGVESAGIDSNAKPHAFVAMPFADEFSDRFHYGIERPVIDAGLLCERLDEMRFTGDVMTMMENRIRTAEVVVADLSTANPNVYLEVGFARGVGRPAILLCGVDSQPAFDVQGHRLLRFTTIRDLEDKLRKELAGLRSSR